MSSEEPVFKYARKMLDAITCLKDSGHQVGGLILIYAGIDQMAWLSSNNPESTGEDFKVWVEKYILTKNPLGCSASDLWGARCGLLHTGAAESRELRRGNAQNKIYYTYGDMEKPKPVNPGIVFISYEYLAISYLAGSLWFLDDLKANPEMLKNANEKLKTTLISASL